MDTTGTAVTLRSSTITRALAWTATLLVAAGVAGQFTKYLTGHDRVFGLIDLFSLDREGNAPTFFSVLLLLLAAHLLAAIALSERGRRDAVRWTVLAIGFAAMTVDEACSLHEKIDIPVRERLGDVKLGLFYYVWVIPAGVLVAALGLYFLGFLRRLPRVTAHQFVLAAVLYVGGAIGLEVFEGAFHEAHGTRHLFYHLLVAVEEGMEMAGVIVFIHALLEYFAREHGGVRLRVTGTPAHEASEGKAGTVAGRDATPQHAPSLQPGIMGRRRA